VTATGVKGIRKLLFRSTSSITVAAQNSGCVVLVGAAGSARRYSERQDAMVGAVEQDVFVDALREVGAILRDEG